MRLQSRGVWPARLVLFGAYCRIRPLVFVGAPFPGVIGGGEVERDASAALDPAVPYQLAPVVRRDRVDPVPTVGQEGQPPSRTPAL